MDLIVVCSIGILMLLGYLVFRYKTEPKRKMILDKGGIVDSNDYYTPDMSRSDLQEFLSECELNGINRAFAEEFLLQLYNFSQYIQEPPAPRLSDDMMKEWGLDDDIEDLINPILAKHNLPKVSWNQMDILKLSTMRDLILFIYNKTSAA